MLDQEFMQQRVFPGAISEEIGPGGRGALHSPGAQGDALEGGQVQPPAALTQVGVVARDAAERAGEPDAVLDEQRLDIGKGRLTFLPIQVGEGEGLCFGVTRFHPGADQVRGAGAAPVRLAFRHARLRLNLTIRDQRGNRRPHHQRRALHAVQRETTGRQIDEHQPAYQEHQEQRQCCVNHSTSIVAIHSFSSPSPL